MSKKRLAKETSTAPEPELRYLSPADHVAVTIADAEANVAKAEHERDVARLQAFRLQAQLQIEQGEKKLAEVKARASAAAKERGDLAAELAARYAISWSCTVLSPLTGELVALPKD